MSMVSAVISILLIAISALSISQMISHGNSQALRTEARALAAQALTVEISRARVPFQAQGSLHRELAQIAGGDPEKTQLPIPNLESAAVFRQLFGVDPEREFQVLNRPAKIKLEATSHRTDGSGGSVPLTSGVSAIDEVDYIKIHGEVSYELEGAHKVISQDGVVSR